MKLDPYLTKLPEITSKFRGVDLIHAEQVRGGRNSRVYKIFCADEKTFIVKFYFRHRHDQRKCLENEFLAFQFLWQNGIRHIPQPLLANETQDYAIYEYIEGTKITASKVTESDVDQLVQFLTILRELNDTKGSEAIPSASEAFFSMHGIVTNLNTRLSLLQSRAEAHLGLIDFLKKEYVPFLMEVIHRSQSKVKDWGLLWGEELEESKRTLSPSDFGFHNALKNKNGEIIYLDFEYFGWDDPAKMISDFLLHPGMKLDEERKQQFAQNIFPNFAQDEFLVDRVRTVYPLFGLKWCLILLNEFLSENLQKRGFAGKHSIDKNLYEIQLVKAQKMLEKVIIHDQQFPYA